MSETSYYDIHKTFWRSVTARDIANPLPSFDATAPAGMARAAMQENGYPVAGVRQAGLVTGYLEPGDLGEGLCGEFARPFDKAMLLSETASLAEVVQALGRAPYLFVTLLGQVGGFITRGDLQDPPVRMWLFGLITVLEMRFRALIATRFPGDSWGHLISPARLGKARLLKDERLRRGQRASLLDCLQLSDKAKIISRDDLLRQQAGFQSRSRADTVASELEKLRNNLAHSQDIAAFNWDTIFLIAENLERVLELSEEARGKPPGS